MFFLLGLDCDILDEEGFDEVTIDDFLIFVFFFCELEQWFLSVDNNKNDSCVEMATDIFWTDFFELSLTMDEIDFRFALQKEVSIVVNDPLREVVADSHTQMDEVR